MQDGRQRRGQARRSSPGRADQSSAGVPYIRLSGELWARHQVFQVSTVYYRSKNFNSLFSNALTISILSLTIALAYIFGDYDMPEMPKNIGTRYNREWHFIPSATLYVCKKSHYRQRFTLHFPSILHLSSEFCPILAPTLFHILSPPDISRLFYFPQSLIKGSVLEKLFHFEWD